MVLKAVFIEEISAMLAVTLNTINRKIPVLLSITENMNNLCDPAFQVLVVQVVNSFLFEKQDQVNNHQRQIFTKEKAIFIMNRTLSMEFYRFASAAPRPGPTPLIRIEKL